MGERVAVLGGGSLTASIAELVSSGAGVIAICADASRRAALASGAAGLARFNGGAALIACQRCGEDRVRGLIARGPAGLALTDFAALRSEPGLIAAFEHVVLVDPPGSEGDEERVRGGHEGASTGFLHSLWTEAEVPFSLRVLAEQVASRGTVTRVFKGLREAGEVRGPQLRAALATDGAHPLSAESAARCFRVLRELGLVAGEPNSGDGVVRVVSSERTDLERSGAFNAYSEEFSEAQQYLERRKLP